MDTVSARSYFSVFLRLLSYCVANIVIKLKKSIHREHNVMLAFSFARFLREALNLSRSVLSYKYVVHELIPEKNQYNNLRAGDPDWTAWNPEHMAKG